MTKSAVSYFVFFIKQQQWFFLVLVLTAVVYSLGQSILPLFIKHIINTLYVSNADINHFLVIKNMLMLLFFWMASNFAAFIQGKLLVKALPTLSTHISNLAIEHLQQRPHSEVTKLTPGLLARKLTDLTASTEKISHFIFVNVVNLFITTLFTLILLTTCSPLFLFIAIAWLCLHASNVICYLIRGSQYSVLWSDKAATVSSKLVDLLSNIRAIHVFSTHQHERLYLQDYFLAEEQASREALSVLERMKVRQLWLSAAFIVISILVLVTQQLHHQMTVGDFTMVVILVFNLTSITWAMTFQFVSITREFGSFMASVNVLFSHRLFDKADKSVKMSLESAPEIRFQQVCFNYPGEAPLFNNLDLTIRPGEKVAIWGPSGSGKTSLINLLLRLYEPVNGEITINGQNISTYPIEVLSALIAYVPQETLFFNRSILENVRYGCFDATDQEVIAACELANCTDFINTFEKRYQTVVGEKACYLSAGQRQRLAFARAVLKKSALLILDEPTSSLDDDNSAWVENAIIKIAKNKTLLLITHRESTLKCVERLISLKSEKVTTDG